MCGEEDCREAAWGRSIKEEPAELQGAPSHMLPSASLGTGGGWVLKGFELRIREHWLFFKKFIKRMSGTP